MTKKIKRYIFTGMPGSGKTSVIRELKRRDYSVVDEAATDFIIEAQKNGKMKPWEEDCFIDEIIDIQRRRQIEAKGEVIFFDRSPFSTYALSEYFRKTRGKPNQSSFVLKEEINRCLENKIYQNKVFFFENFGFIENNAVRQISYEEALILEEMHLKAYQDFGFELIKVPCELDVGERSDFILEKVRQRLA